MMRLTGGRGWWNLAIDLPRQRGLELSWKRRPGEWLALYWSRYADRVLTDSWRGYQSWRLLPTLIKPRRKP